MSDSKRILIADDEPLFRETTAEFLRDEGYTCICVEDADDAIEVLQNHSFDLILSDLNMPGNLKFELLREGRQQYSHIPMIIITGVPSIPSAIESVKLGIADYLLKPIKFDDLLVAVQRAIEGDITRAKFETEAKTRESSERETEDHSSGNERSSIATANRASNAFREIIGDSPSMREVLDVVERVAASNTNVLVTGESGTGKEVIARMIHRLSPRGSKPLGVIDCTSVPESLFESTLFGHVKGSFTGAIKDHPGLLRSCDGGTAFFDELGELPAAAQAKLLRVVQEQTFTPVGESKPAKVDVRFVCATNRDLAADVDNGRFRQDLYYRLAVIHMELPPLRERGDDVILLATAFLDRLRPANSNIKGFADESIECFKRYPWPGNIRELRNVVERAVTLARGEIIALDDLPVSLRESTTDSQIEQTNLAEISRDEALDNADRAYLRALLKKHDGGIASAARQAGLSRQGMHKLLQRHGINADEFR
jgi:DNA-binding NtrC family response regulator